MEKGLPQNIEAECGVLGSLLIDPDAVALVADLLRPGDFYREAHRSIYEAILHLHGLHRPADFITLCDELGLRGTLEEVGGASYLTSLVNLVPTSGNAEHYARIVLRTSVLRRLIHAAGRIAAIAYEADDAEQALEQAEQLIFAIGQQQGHDDLVPVAEALTDYLRALDGRHEQQDGLIGVPTGFRDLDEALGGLQPADLVILAARPGQGKSSLALGIAYRAVYQHGRRVAIFSLEMSRSQLVQRLLSLEASIDQHRLRMGWLRDEEWERLVGSTDVLSGGTLWIDDTARLSIAQLASRAHRVQAKSGLDLIVADYLQLLQATIEGKRQHVREQEIAEVSRGLKSIAKELNVPVLALAQLSRAVESRASKVPQLSDLRESGAIENDADVVLFIYRDEQQAQGASGLTGGQQQLVDLIIAKHRNGPIGYIRLGWNATLTRFSDLEEGDATGSKIPA
jgi:replicative DNA helicase